MRIKSGILNFSHIVGIVLVTVSIWGDKIIVSDNAEIQNPALIFGVCENHTDDFPGETHVREMRSESKVSKHINYSFRDEYMRIGVYLE